MVVVKANSLDLSNVTFSDTKTDVHGRKMVFINQNNGSIMVQTPKMYAPNGIKRWRKQGEEDKFEIELAFNGENGTDKNSKEVREFHQKWQEFDELIKRKVIENCKDWVGIPNLTKETLEAVMYTPMVRVPKDKDGNVLDYPSRVRAKIDREGETGRFLSNKKYKTEVLLFDENKERIPLNEDNAEDAIPKGSHVICILELVYLSLSKTTISSKWKLVQAKVFRPKNSITEYALLDEDNEEQADLDTEQDAVDVVEAGESDGEAGAEDVHEESDEEPAEAPKPALAPAKPKGRSKRSVA